MNGPQLFGVIVRTVGLGLTLVSLRNLFVGFTDWMSGDVARYSVLWVIGVLLGLYLLRGAGLIMRFAYPSETRSDTQRNAEPESGHVPK